MTARLVAGLSALALSACTPAPLTEAEVHTFVKEYVAATNAGDASKLMSLVSKDGGVSSVARGHVDRGWEAIRTATDKNVTSTNPSKVAVGTIDVTPLGTDSAVAVAPFKISQPTPFQIGGTVVMSDAQGAATMVVKRTAEGLRLIHEHYSFR
jgi:uncharacterized protein (TIGR02246 family)